VESGHTSSSLLIQLEGSRPIEFGVLLFPVLSLERAQELVQNLRGPNPKTRFLFAIKLTLHTAPGGLRADGEDVALIDVEVVDANGERCPTDDARVDFNWSSTGRTVSATGPAIWRGGYNSCKTNSTNNLYLNTECGINRVAMRSTLMPGTIKLTATREGLQPATIHDHCRDRPRAQ
jgi:Glycoside hydrolase family 2 C-terminal domain 5